MKVLHVEGGAHLFGGARQVMYLIEGLRARGIANVLLCRRGSDVARAAVTLAQVIEAPMGGDADLRIIGWTRRAIARERPDLVHLHSRIGADVMGGIAARLAGVPVVHTRRVDNPEPRWQVALKYRLHDRVIAISEAIGRVLLAEGLPAARLRVVRSAIPPSAFGRCGDRAPVLARLGLPADAVVLGVVAQLIPRKGHRFLLDALPGLIDLEPRLRVVFFGKGPLAEPLAARIAAAGLDGRVTLAGFRDDLADILPCLDLLVHPATLEGLGVALLQAAAAGVPIVASAAGGIPEAVHDGVNGLLVPPGDVPALAAAVARLLTDPDLRQRLGAGGVDLMRRAFSVDAMVDGNLAVYRELVG